MHTVHQMSTQKTVFLQGQTQSFYGLLKILPCLMKWGHSHNYMDFILPFQLEAEKQDKGCTSLTRTCQEMITIKASFIVSSE